MRRLMFVLGIAILALIALSVGLMGDGLRGTASQGNPSVQAGNGIVTATGAITQYLPVVMQDCISTTPTVAITVPLQFIVGQSVAAPPSWEMAFNATGYFRTIDGVYLEAVNGGNTSVYRIDRAFLLAQVPDIGAGQIVSAGLCFFVASTSNCTVTVHAGEWVESGLPTLPANWQTYGHVEGMVVPTYDPSGYWYPFEIPLDPGSLEASQTWKGVLRVPDDAHFSTLGPYGGMFTAAGDCVGLPPSAGEGCFEPYLRLVVVDG